MVQRSRNALPSPREKVAGQNLLLQGGFESIKVITEKNPQILQGNCGKNKKYPINMKKMIDLVDFFGYNTTE